MNSETAKAKLIHFFETHNPDRLSAVDDILTSYENDYDQLFRDLKERYPSIDVYGTINNVSAPSSAQQQQSQSPSSPKRTSDDNQQQQEQESSNMITPTSSRGWTRNPNSRSS